MAGESEHGQCELCKTVTGIQRTYYHYNIDCDCCHGEHFQFVRHCSKCTPKEPLVTKVHILTEVLKKMSTDELPMAISALRKALKDDESYRIVWVANIAMAFKDEMHRSSVHSPNPDNFSYLVTPEMLHKISNQAAENFINLIIK